jgi:hypothetical protein
VAVREQEAVAALPLGLVGAELERMAVGDGEDVGPAERLADVALALHLAHAQGIAPDAVGARGEKRQIRHEWIPSLKNRRGQRIVSHGR